MLVGITDSSQLVQQVLRLVNAVRAEVGDTTLKSLPLGSLSKPEQACPVARALCALILPEERRVAFCYAWYATAASKIWGEPFRDTLLLSVSMPDEIHDFAMRFRSGAFPELSEQLRD
jgi:hypothetical protein